MASDIVLKNNLETELRISHINDKSAKRLDTDDLTYTRATVADMEAISNPQDGDVCFVKDLDRGGSFIYDSSEVANDNQGTNFNGWIRQYSGHINVKWFGAVGDGITDDTIAIQNAIDSLPLPDGHIDGAINKPNSCGGVIKFNSTGTGLAYSVNSLVIPQFVTLEGTGSGSTTIEVSGSIKWKSTQSTNFDVCWGIRVKGIQFRGATGTEDLFIGADYNGSGGKNWNRYPLLDSYFEDVEFTNANKCFQFSGGWNNTFIRCSFRNANIGTELDGAYNETDFSLKPTAFCDDNIFINCEYNNCDISVRGRFALGNQWITPAAYSSSTTHFVFVDSTSGNIVNGGRLEQSKNSEFVIDGGDTVANNGTTYSCILQHTSTADNEPGVGTNWTTYWKEFSLFPAPRTWSLGTTYRASQAIKNKFINVNFYEGASTWYGRDNELITRSSYYEFGYLYGDQYSQVIDCFSGNSVIHNIVIGALSVSARVENCKDVEVDDNSSSDSTFILEHTYGNRPKWVSGEDTLLEINNKELIRLTKQTGIATSTAGATSTVIFIDNNSSTDTLTVTPKNSSAASIFSYAALENNDKIRITHSSAVGGEEFYYQIL